jgi:hypothetical protein
VRKPAPFLAPDDVLRQNNPLLDYERGGIALNNPIEGLDYQNWWIYYTGTEVRIASEGGYDGLVVASNTVTEVSLSFDQNMRYAVAYVDDGVAKLIWYDTEVAQQVTTVYPGIRTPMLGLDIKPVVFTDISDIMLVYLRDLDVCYRTQRERFLQEHVIAQVKSLNSKILGAGMNRGNRFQIYVRTIT